MMNRRIRPLNFALISIYQILSSQATWHSVDNNLTCRENILLVNEKNGD